MQVLWLSYIMIISVSGGCFIVCQTIVTAMSSHLSKCIHNYNTLCL